MTEQCGTVWKGARRRDATQPRIAFSADCQNTGGTRRVGDEKGEVTIGFLKERNAICAIVRILGTIQMFQ